MPIQISTCAKKTNLLNVTNSNYNSGKHTIFGRVCEGMTVVKNLGMVETANQDRPTEDVLIRRAYPVES